LLRTPRTTNGPSRQSGKTKASAQEVAAIMLEKEHNLLQALSGHPNIIKSFNVNLEGFVQSGDQSEPVMYSLLEFAKNGALSNFVRYTGGIEERISKLFALQICNAVKFIHDLGYAHLDLKLENILLDEFYNIKLADMGSSHYTTETKGLINKKRGTLLYMAPEVARFSPGDEYDAMAADIYSLGITLFVLVNGEFPSPHQINSNMTTIDTDGRQSFDSSMDEESESDSKSECVSKELLSLVKSMTNEDPSKRPSVSEVLCHPWFNEEISGSLLEETYQEMNYRKDYMVQLFSKNKAEE
jgi:serine/threonine protein kinase